MNMEGTKSQQAEFIPSFLSGQCQFDYSSHGENGLLLNNIYLPEEIMLHIFSYIKAEELLKYALVCRNWNGLIKSNRLWYAIYKRKYNRKSKMLPWYLYYCLLSTDYFDTNLFLNKERVVEWTHMIHDYEKIDPESAVIRQANIKEDKVFVLIVQTNQIAPHGDWCGTRVYPVDYNIQRLIKLGTSKLFQYILDVYKPHIYLKKWGNMWKLEHGFLGKDVSRDTVSNRSGEQFISDSCAYDKWNELTITQYPEQLEGILLELEYTDIYKHSARDIRKGSVKILFDSIEPIDAERQKKPKKFYNFEYISKHVPPPEDLFEGLFYDNW